MMVQTDHVANIFGVRFLPSSDNRHALAPTHAEQVTARLLRMRLVLLYSDGSSSKPVCSAPLQASGDGCHGCHSPAA